MGAPFSASCCRNENTLSYETDPWRRHAKKRVVVVTRRGQNGSMEQHSTANNNVAIQQERTISSREIESKSALTCITNDGYCARPDASPSIKPPSPPCPVPGSRSSNLRRNSELCETTRYRRPHFYSVSEEKEAYDSGEDCQTNHTNLQRLPKNSHESLDDAQPRQVGVPRTTTVTQGLSNMFAGCSSTPVESAFVPSSTCENNNTEEQPTQDENGSNLPPASCGLLKRTVSMKKQLDALLLTASCSSSCSSFYSDDGLEKDLCAKDSVQDFVVTAPEFVNPDPSPRGEVVGKLSVVLQNRAPSVSFADSDESFQSKSSSADLLSEAKAAKHQRRHSEVDRPVRSRRAGRSALRKRRFSNDTVDLLGTSPCFTEISIEDPTDRNKHEATRRKWERALLCSS